MSKALLDLRATLNESHEDSIYSAHLSLKQLAARETDPGTRALLSAVVDVLDAAYAEVAAA